MKIRIKDNSVRFRLSKTEIDQFGEHGYVESQTNFGTTAFTYGVVAKHDAAKLSAHFDQEGIRLFVPQHWADEWVATQRVGFETLLDLPDGKELFLLLEKDFQCLDDRGEDESDLYPNPLAQNTHEK